MTQINYKQIFTAANIVTTVRIALIPIFIVVILAPWPSWVPDTSVRGILEVAKPWLAAGVFALLALTDRVDGYLARSRNEVTTLGKFLDPLADKILVSAALLALVELGGLPTWVALVIITREFLVSGLRMVASSEGQVIAASSLGKIKTLAQIVAVLLFIVKSNPSMAARYPQQFAVFDVFSWAVMLLALLLTLLSLADYLFKFSSALAMLPNKGSSVATCTAAETAAIPAPKVESAAVDDAQTGLCLACEGTSVLAEQVIAQAQQRGLSLGTAESCTGGMVAAALTAVAGASDVFFGAVVSYTNAVKQERLKVAATTLREQGAVSEQTAREMAIGALDTLGIDVAVSITGIAGPGGGSIEKPVGTVWIAIAISARRPYTQLVQIPRDTSDVRTYPAPSTDQYVRPACADLSTRARRYHFKGDREQIRDQATHAALEMLCVALSDLPG